MDINEFKNYGYQLIDWIAEYFENIENLPVKSNILPRQIYNSIPELPPWSPEDFKEILSDFNKIILPGITHWQHPSFFAYFPANNSYPSILGEILTAAIGAQCMIWETSPSATELEQAMMDWFKKCIGLPSYFEGVIQDTASTATLVSILTAREKLNNFVINNNGFNENRLRVYCSEEAHSSIEKAVKIAGIGKINLIKIDVDENYSMRIDSLESAIQNDIQNGYKPLCIVSALGTTGSLAIDPIEEIGLICQKFGLWHHIDAAYAGTALLLEDFRKSNPGIELCDTFVFNPHKWLFTNFDCSCYFVKDKNALIQTFEITPSYLQTDYDARVNNYRDWGIQLGRRFRALKLWFVLRSYGIEEIRKKLQHHIELANYFAEWIRNHNSFEILAPVNLNLVCFRFFKNNLTEIEINAINKELETKINQSGKAFISHTTLNGKYTLRAVFGQTNVSKRNVDVLIKTISEQIESF